jgi:PhnB protein
MRRPGIFSIGCRVMAVGSVFKTSSHFKPSIHWRRYMPENAKPKGSLVPYVSVDGAVKAADFYKKAFGAEVAAIHPPDAQGRTMHVHLYVNGSSLMLSDPFPEHGHPLRQPAAFTLTLLVEDVDAWFERAVRSGCTGTTPPSDMFWGDRFASLKDPFGVDWGLNGPVKK